MERFWWRLGILAAILAVSLYGQATQSTILGSVTDSSGSAVAGAKVVVRNEGTNTERALDVTSEGDYRVTGLETGRYAVTVSAPGFKTTTRSGLVLTSNQNMRVDMSLEVGDVSTTVKVEGEVSPVATETMTISNTKTTRDFQQLPLSVFGRGWANITNVTAGVSSASGFEVNGARDTANNFTSDGISVNDITSSRNTPNGFSGEVEVIQEVKVMTANTSAEFPQVAQFAAVTKSGTNQLHGSLYWGNFNSMFSARAWQDTQSPSFTNHNMFAITNGGPVYIPKIYDGRNRTFYFFSYGGARYRIGNRSFTQVPTPEFRQGDFSALLGSINIVDPVTGMPFPGNRIPASRISSVSKNMQDQVYPDPNRPGVGAFGLTTNFTGDPGGKFDSDVYSYRVDHRITDSNTIFVRVGYTQNNRDTYPGVLKNSYGEDAYYGNHPGNTVVVSDTHVFNPSLLNELKLGFTRDFSSLYPFDYGKDVLSTLGLQGIDNPGNDPAISGMPAFTFSGQIGFQGTSTFANGNIQAQNTYQIIDNVSWFKGRHSFKMGVNIWRYQINDQNKPQSVRGAFDFDDRLSGFSYANFLLGYPSGATRSIARPNAYPRSTQYGFYFQDDFKLHKRVTLNYGLRYDYQSPWVEKYNRMFTFDPRTGNLVTAGNAIPTDLVPQVAATLPIVTAASAGLPERSLANADGNNWSPRVGLAIRPFGDASTVVRLGYGFYTGMWPGLLALNATGGPWQSEQSFIIQGNQPTIQFPNPFETNSSFAGLQSISGRSVNFPNERTQQWNFSIGRELWGTAIDVGYVGTKGQNLPFVQDLNLLQPSTVPFDPLRRPYPLFNSASLTQSGGSSIYHGLIVQAERRMAKGLYFNANYTWAKALTDVDLRNYSPGAQQNQYQRYLERGDDPNIRRQDLRFSYTYELPIGRGKTYLSSIPTFADLFIGGWQIGGITTMQTGARVSPVFSGVDPTNTNQFSGRPDRIGDGNFDPDTMRSRIKERQPIFDVTSFVRPASGRGYYGNSARTILTGPGTALWNTVLAKNFYIKERARAQFRWEMFNASNRANFSNGNTNINGGSFGLVTSAGSGRSMLFGLRFDY